MPLTVEDLAATGCPGSDHVLELLVSWLAQQEFESLADVRGCRRLFQLRGAGLGYIQSHNIFIHYCCRRRCPSQGVLGAHCTGCWQNCEIGQNRETGERASYIVSQGSRRFVCCSGGALSCQGPGVAASNQAGRSLAARHHTKACTEPLAAAVREPSRARRMGDKG